MPASMHVVGQNVIPVLQQPAMMASLFGVLALRNYAVLETSQLAGLKTHVSPGNISDAVHREDAWRAVTKGDDPQQVQFLPGN
jgi:hypothetical protein